MKRVRKRIIRKVEVYTEERGREGDKEKRSKRKRKYKIERKRKKIGKSNGK